MNDNVMSGIKAFHNGENARLNYEKWVERYQASPSIGIGDGSPVPGGSGFITQSSPNWKDALDARKAELDHAQNPQDRQRLELLYNAEQKACGFHGKREARQALGDLMEYDRQHNHPITDTARDLNAEPYTMAEKHAWFNRDGRTPNTAEVGHMQGKGWDDPSHPTREQTAVLGNAQDKEWFIHPQVKPQVEAARNASIERKQEQEQTVQVAQEVAQPEPPKSVSVADRIGAYRDKAFERGLGMGD